MWNSPFGKSFFLQSHKCFFLLGFFQVEKMLSEAVAISSQDIFIDPNQRASIKKHCVTLWGYFNYEKCCKQLKESKCLMREKAFHCISLRKHFFLIIQVLKPFLPQGQGPRWPFQAHTEHNSFNKIVLECPEIFLSCTNCHSSPDSSHPLCKHRYKLPCCCCFATLAMLSAKTPAPVQGFQESLLNQL